MICSALNSICVGIGACGNPGDQRAQAGQQPQRLGGAVVLGGEPVGIELPRRERGVQQRRGAEADVARACEFQRALLGAIAGLELFEPRGGRIGLDLRAISATA